MTHPKIEYVILDVDGLLIDSEHAYSTVKRNILARYGKPFPPELERAIMGKPARDSAAHVLSVYPDIPLTVDEYLHLYDSGLLTVWETVTYMPGAEKLVAHLRAHGIPMALATGGRRINYTNKTKPAHLKPFFDHFEDLVICGSDAPPMKTKPAPDIYLRTAREKFGLAVGYPHEESSEAQRELRQKILVFEDGLHGMQGGRRAGMSVVWVPDAELAKLEYSGVEQPDQLLHSLEAFRPEEWGLPPYSSRA